MLNKEFSDIGKQKESVTSMPTLQDKVEAVLSGRRKMMPGGNFNPHKGNNITGNGNSMGKCLSFFPYYLSIIKRQLFKQIKII